MNRHALGVGVLLAAGMAGCGAPFATDDGQVVSGTPHAAELRRPPHDPETPDLTKGEGPDLRTASRGDWFLHCAGCRGWIYKDAKGKGDKARQILVTRVPVDSSLRRTLEAGDVILGVNGKYFGSHAVYEFRKTSLPAKSVSGKFDVILFRKGWEKERTVELDLAFLPLDFMRGEKPGLAVDWNLGPTGARGWIQGRHEESIQARQILVTSVEASSPAEGILQKGDIILGVEGSAFDRDARRAFGEAVTRAETESGGGQLRVLRYRGGSSGEVAIAVDMLGSYSDTTPWDCPKSQKVLDRACAYLIGKEVLGSRGILHGQTIVGSLALMATGEQKYMAAVRGHVRKLTEAVAQSGSYPPVWGYPSWGWGYGNLLLTEYHLLTGDRSVLPAIEKYSNAMARGQSGVGSWGHSMAMPNHGYCNGYGALNQAGNICWMSLLLAKKCGVTNPEIERAITRGYDYLSFFINKQCVPYGDHIALDCTAHDDNGKNSAVACAFAMLGDSEGTEFFSRMTVASYAVREHGHTGNWFSLLWGPLGASRAGPQACSAFLREMTWLHDLERRWDGGFTYQGKAGIGYGVDERSGRQRNGAEHQYPGWDTTGSRILMYCLPRKVLHITGKGVLTTPIPDDQIAPVIHAGRPPKTGNSGFPSKYDDESAPELLELLGSWSPVVRHFAALSLSKKGGDYTDGLLALLNGREANARYGACTALRKMGSRSARAVDALIGHLHSDDQLLQTHAIMALAATGDRRAVRPLLELAAGEFPNDRKGIMHRIVARALFARSMHGGQDGLLANSIDGVGRELLYPAVRRLLRCKGGHERSMTADAVLKKLTLTELQPLWPSMIRAMKECAPTGVMFASEVRMSVAELLAENRIVEGMRLVLEYSKLQKMHGAGGRTPMIMNLLKQYEASAKPLIPAMEEYVTFLEGEHPHTDRGRPSPQRFYRSQVPLVREAIDSVKSSNEAPGLISIEEYLDQD
ncbi:MAG: DUF6288 domain-containing protein [Planctomycetota bacterium]|jgi:hypothetical protein